MSDELSVSSLITFLEDLVDWESVAIHLPGMTPAMIETIQKDHKGNKKQKMELYSQWLDVCPSANWNNLEFALRKARKIALADKLADEIKPRAEGELIAIEKHFETIDESVTIELRELSLKYESLLTLAEERCSVLVSKNEVSLKNLLKPFLSHEAYRIVLESVKSVDQLFVTLRSYNLCTFLDIDALHMIVNKLPASPELASNISNYTDEVKELKRKTEIQNLKDKLKPLIRKARLEEIKLKVFFELEEATELNMSLFDTLVKTLFSGLHNTLKWYDVVPGSVRVVFISCLEYSQSQLDTVCTELEKKHGFLQLLGMISLSVDYLNENIFEYEHKSTSDFSFESSLLEASSTANVEALMFLLDVIKVDINCQGPAHETALTIAVENNHIEIAQILLKAKAYPNHQMRDDGNTPLHIACYRGYTQLAIMLIEYGADPSITNAKRDTPFLSSIRGNMIEVIRAAAPKVPSSQLPPALLLACRLGYSDIISFILQYAYASSSTLHQYCVNDDLALAAEHVVQFHDNIDCTVVSGITPLMIASSCGHTEVVECLTEAKPDVINSVDEDGYSPLAYTITGSKSLPVAQCLLEAGADPYLTVQEGVSLLQLAKQHDSDAIIGLLFRFMASRLHQMFSSLVKKVQEDLKHEIIQHKTTFREIKDKVRIKFLYVDGLAEVNDLGELFDALQPFNDFLSWKAISLLSGRLKQEGYFQAVKEFEEIEIELFSQLQATASLFPVDIVDPPIPPIQSSYSVISFSLHKQWSDKTLFNLRGVSSMLFSSLAQFMSHLTVTTTPHDIIVNYNIPKSVLLAEALQSMVSLKHEVCIILGVHHIQLNNNVLLMVEIDASFHLESSSLINILSSSLLSRDNKEEIVKRLVSFKGIDVDDNKNEYRLTPLHLASYHGLVKVVDLLLSHGANPTTRDNLGQTPLIAAAYIGHYSIVECFVLNNIDLVNTPDFENRTPLICACFKGHSNVIDYLLKKGANPNFIPESGHTALIIASAQEHLDILQILLEAGADPNLGHSKFGKSCLMIASVISNIEIVKLLLLYNADHKYTVYHSGIPMDSFAFACITGNMQLVDVYLRMTTLSNTSLSIGWYIACMCNHPRLIRHLVNVPQLSNSKRELVLACVEGNIMFIKSKLGGYHPVDEQFVHGVTLLMIACSCDNSDLVRVLLGAGANLTRDEFGFNAYSYCKKLSPIRNLLLAKFGNREPNMDQPVFDKTTFLQDFASDLPVSKGLFSPFGDTDVLETGTSSIAT